MRPLSVLSRLVPLVLAILAIPANPFSSIPSPQPEPVQAEALVYCPVSVDADGCGRIVSVLEGGGAFSSVSQGYDGSDGTVDLATADLNAYSVLFVPSLADHSDAQPYGVLRHPSVRKRLSDATIGRIGVWSGAPDQGDADEGKDALIRNLATWAAAPHAIGGGMGVVALQDLSEASTPYEWLAGFTGLAVAGVETFAVHSETFATSDAGDAVLNSGGATLAYFGMATFGLERLDSDPNTTTAARGSSADGPPILVIHENPMAASSLTSEITLVAGPTDPVAVGTELRVSGEFSLPDPTVSHSAILHWGDGSSSMATVNSDGSGGTFTGTRSYVSPGAYTVEVVLSASNGGETRGSWEYVTVFDPDGEHVIGNGAIDSPPGAYQLDPELTGPATFGFQSRYRRGANAPMGNVQFRFRVGNLRFVSQEQDWLVVAGARAQFKGRGTINNQGDYGYMITAIDGNRQGGGGIDRFRIKIWDADDQVVYDNQMGADDDADPTTGLTRGRITIHRAGRNTAPSVIITSPSDGSTAEQGQPVDFSATAGDREEGDLSGSVSWSSGIDGFLDTGRRFSRSDLSVGEHEITATVTDAGGLVGEARIHLTILASDQDPEPAQLVFEQQPTSAVAGASLSTVSVHVQDAFGNLVTSSSASVTLALSTGSPDATLSGATTVSAIGGIATFTGLSIDAVGEGYRLTATAGGLVSTISDAFNTLPDGVSAMWVGGAADGPTSWSNPANWSPEVVPGTEDFAYVSAATENQPRLTESSGVGGLLIQEGGLLDLSMFTLTAHGDLQINGEIIGDGLTVAVGSGGTIGGRFSNVRVTGSRTATEPVAAAGDLSIVGSSATLSAAQRIDVTGDLVIEGGGAHLTMHSELAVSGRLLSSGPAGGGLTLGGPTEFGGSVTLSAKILVVGPHDLTIGGNLSTGSGPGHLQMTDAAGQVTVGGNASFAGWSGSDRLSAGLLEIHGSFAQSGASTSITPRVFKATGEHVTRLAGTDGPQTVSFAAPGTGLSSSRFHHLEVTNPEGVVFASNAVASGDMEALPGGLLAQSDGGLLTVQGDLTTGGGISLERLTVQGTLTAEGPTQIDQDLVVGGSIVTPGSVTAPNLSVGGVLDVGGEYTVPETTSFTGSGQVVPDQYAYNHLRVTGTATRPAALSLPGNLTIEGSGARLTMEGDLEVAGSLFSAGPTGGGLWLGGTTGFGGNVALSAKTLVVGPHELTIGGNLSTGGGPGHLQMTVAAGQVTVGGNASFAGWSTSDRLTAGLLEIHGSFTQSGANTSSAPRVFKATGEHITRLAGTAGSQTVSFAAPGTGVSSSRFHHLEVTNPDGVTFTSNATAGGDLELAGQMTINVDRTVRALLDLLLRSGAILNNDGSLLFGGSMTDEGATINGNPPQPL